MDELMIKIDNVKKEYTLGAIGGTTLRDELQRRRARRKHLEDPTRKIGAKEVSAGEKFMALNGVSFEVKKGEAVGIIGHNGAGKSTLLKLITRITAPTEGDIYLNGRVASMLEVGTGFHGEMTGRENIYLNGAILGMTRAEIDAKMEDIIEFSEVRQFIDTPVKRYSSGMFVKLGFAVAAHLDSEIMIMDEVLAVGDMAFQNKCLQRMREAAKQEGRTVLYVSHNMNTIRTLCDRCIVMEHGQVVFDGDVEEAIGLYLGTKANLTGNDILVTEYMHDTDNWQNRAQFHRITSGSADSVIVQGENIWFDLTVKSNYETDRELYVRMMLRTAGGQIVTMSASEKPFAIRSGETLTKRYQFHAADIVPGKYTLSFVLYEIGDLGAAMNVDVLRDVYSFTIDNRPGFNHDMPWNPQWWGHYHAGALELLNEG